jgi:hypothetical protein
VNDTVGHVEKLRNESRQYIAGQAWDLLVTLACSLAAHLDTLALQIIGTERCLGYRPRSGRGVSHAPVLDSL